MTAMQEPSATRGDRWPPGVLSRVLLTVAIGVGSVVGVLGGTAAAAASCQTYSSPSTGSHSVCGAILHKYQALGGPSSFLGYPTTDETGTPDGLGRFNDFSNGGSIYWTPETGAWSVHGAIQWKWGSLGWERSALGYPVSDEQASADGRVSTFQGGRLDWNASTRMVTQEYGANPLRGITNLQPGRIDEGVDYAGSGPIYAIGPGVVLNLYNAGWPGGAYISYRLTSGPRVNMVVYVAENVIPTVFIGQRVDTSTVLGQLIDAYPNLETGWSDPAGTGNALAYDNGHLVYPSAEGLDFNQLLISLGAPGGS